MLGFIILFILLHGSTQKSTPSGVVHIMAVNGPLVQNDQVVQKTLLLDSKRRLARTLCSSDQRTLLPRSLMSFFCFFSLICYFTPTLLDTVLLSYTSVNKTKLKVN